MRWFELVAGALLPLLLAAPAVARELWERKWIEVRTQHFTVASALDEESTVRVASDLESFRSAVRKFLGVRVEERVPTRVFIVPPRTKELGIDRNQAGWFRPEMRQNVAVVSSAGGGLSLSVTLFHEYAHFLTHNQSGVSYPPWFDEGFAEVLASMTFERDHFFVGNLVRNRREWLQWHPWMSYTRVLRVRDVAKLSPDDRSMFYAQSWALVHFLLLGPHREHFRERMKHYMEAVEAGTPDAAAFAAAFAEEPKDLTRRVLEYLNAEAKIWPMPLPPGNAAAAPSVRVLPRSEIAARIGRVALVSGDLKVARKAFDASLAANPADAMALVGSADLHKIAGRFEQGEPLYQRAIELEPSDAYHKLDYAEYFYDRAAAAMRQHEPQRAAEWFVEARRQLARSYKLDDSVPETLAMNGATYLGDAEGAVRALESLEAAYAMLPSQPQIKILLAQAYAKADRKREAARLIRSLVAWGHTGGSAEAAAFLQALESETEPHEPAESAVPDAGSADSVDTP